MNSESPTNDAQLSTIADLIARSMTSGIPSSDLKMIRESIDEIRFRLDALEESVAGNKETVPGIDHPSQDRFEIAEAIVDRLFDKAGGGEKACIFEPAGKPCDHCSMCSSRGF